MAEYLDQADATSQLTEDQKVTVVILNKMFQKKAPEEEQREFMDFLEQKSNHRTPRKINPMDIIYEIGGFDSPKTEYTDQYNPKKLLSQIAEDEDVQEENEEENQLDQKVDFIPMIKSESEIQEINEDELQKQEGFVVQYEPTQELPDIKVQQIQESKPLIQTEIVLDSLTTKDYYKNTVNFMIPYSRTYLEFFQNFQIVGKVFLLYKYNEIFEKMYSSHYKLASANYIQSLLQENSFLVQQQKPIQVKKQDAQTQTMQKQQCQFTQTDQKHNLQEKATQCEIIQSQSRSFVNQNVQTEIKQQSQGVQISFDMEQEFIKAMQGEINQLKIPAA